MVRESIKPCRDSHREDNTKWFLKDEYEEDISKTHTSMKLCWGGEKLRNSQSLEYEVWNWAGKVWSNEVDTGYTYCAKNIMIARHIVACL